MFRPGPCVAIASTDTVAKLFSEDHDRLAAFLRALWLGRFRYVDRRPVDIARQDHHCGQQGEEEQ